MRDLFWAGLLILAMQTSVSVADSLTEEKSLAYNNFHHEMVECLTYYSIATGALETRGANEVVTSYKKITNKLLERIFLVGKYIGMKQ